MKTFWLCDSKHRYAHQHCLHCYLKKSVGFRNCDGAEEIPSCISSIQGEVTEMISQSSGDGVNLAAIQGVKY